MAGFTGPDGSHGDAIVPENVPAPDEHRPRRVCASRVDVRAAVLRRHTIVFASKRYCGPFLSVILLDEPQKAMFGPSNIRLGLSIHSVVLRELHKNSLIPRV